MTPTLVLGASTNVARTSHTAAQHLLAAHFPVILVGKSGGEIDGQPILKDIGQVGGPIDTVTMYLNAAHQRPLYDSILQLHPRRIIFNPGSENAELAQKAREKGVEVVEACTLVLLSLDKY